MVTGRRHDDDYELIITNTVDTSAGHGGARGSGLGIVGMAERMHAAGGTLTVERDAGRHTVTARFVGPGRVEGGSP